MIVTLIHYTGQQAGARDSASTNETAAGMAVTHSKFDVVSLHTFLLCSWIGPHSSLQKMLKSLDLMKK